MAHPDQFALHGRLEAVQVVPTSGRRQRLHLPTNWPWKDPWLAWFALLVAPWI